MGVICGRNGI